MQQAARLAGGVQLGTRSPPRRPRPLGRWPRRCRACATSRDRARRSPPGLPRHACAASDSAQSPRDTPRAASRRRVASAVRSRGYRGGRLQSRARPVARGHRSPWLRRRAPRPAAAGCACARSRACVPGATTSDAPPTCPPARWPSRRRRAQVGRTYARCWPRRCRRGRGCPSPDSEPEAARSPPTSGHWLTPWSIRPFPGLGSWACQGFPHPSVGHGSAAD